MHEIPNRVLRDTIVKEANDKHREAAEKDYQASQARALGQIEKADQLLKERDQLAQAHRDLLEEASRIHVPD
jgi:hypothetical protein